MEQVIFRLILFIGFLNINFVGAWKGKIVFQDNFDGNHLDLNKWEYQESCGLGIKKVYKIFNFQTHININ